MRDREHGLVLRQAQHEAWRRGGGFLLRGVGLGLGLNGRRKTCVPTTSLTTPAHSKHCSDAGHQLSEQAQHRDQQELKRRWGPHSVCACSCRCHGAENTPGGRTRGKRGVQIFCVSHKSRGQRLEIVGEDFSVSDSVALPGRLRRCRARARRSRERLCASI